MMWQVLEAALYGAVGGLAVAFAIGCYQVARDGLRTRKIRRANEGAIRRRYGYDEEDAWWS